jgi:peptidoglycan L-alanyl-D-glutamate endopeptidase CwlK
MRRYSKRSLNNLKGIHPDLRRVIDRALQDGPLDFIVIEGLRTMQRQRELVASGASKTMNSRHLTGHAVDLLPIGKDGPAFDWPLYDKLGPAVKAAADAEGVEIEWGGDWTKFRDGPHFQLSWDAYPTEEWVTGDEPPKPRKKAQSTTLQAAAGAATAGAGGVATAVGRLDPTAQYIVLGAAAIVALCLLWIMRERIRKWGSGDR